MMPGLKKGNRILCLFCRDYKCLLFDQHVYDRQGVFCDGCQLWIHRKCATISTNEYKELTSQNKDPWYCKNCIRNMFPFYDLNDSKIKTLFKTNNKVKQNGKNIANKCFKNNLPCNVCRKISKKDEKSVLCTTCSSPIHRKCSRLKLMELLEF